jgi:hypothetical protein
MILRDWFSYNIIYLITDAGFRDERVLVKLDFQFPILELMAIQVANCRLRCLLISVLHLSGNLHIALPTTVHFEVENRANARKQLTDLALLSIRIDIAHRNTSLLLTLYH